MHASILATLKFLYFLFLETDHNSCKYFSNYYDVGNSKDCYYNPDVFASTPEIITRHAKVYENHTVTTEDGYILQMFRIPKENPKGVVILQHPVITDASIYVIQSNESLAFLMSQEGYDVWLPNHRGTPYSNQHINLTFSDSEYWNFSFHEIGIYDYSSIIRYIKENTGRSDIVFIGHSMATTSSLIYAALKPTEAQNAIKIFIEMSPTAYLRNVKSPAKRLAPFEHLVTVLTNLLKINALFTQDSLEYYLEKLFLFLPFKRIVVFLLTLATGWTPNEFEPELMNVLLSHNPVSFSLKIVLHYAQIVNSGGIFKYFDYGHLQNIRIYNSTDPPEYPVGNINVPVYLITSGSDSLTTIKDSEILYKKLSTNAKLYGKLDVSGINHIDFHVGRSRINEVYSHIFKLLNTIL